MSSSEYVWIYITAENETEADHVGNALVQEGLAACTNAWQPMHSIFEWDGQLQKEQETVLIAKSKASLVPRITAKVKEVHSYDVPAVLTLPILGGNHEFLDWIDEVTLAEKDRELQAFQQSFSASGELSARALATALDELYGASDFADFGPNGLQVLGSRPIEKVATMVTASAAAIDQAVAWGADALIVHHGIFWQGESPVIQGGHKKRIQTLLQNEVSLLAYHLPMDSHPRLGNSAQLALQLGMTDLKPFARYKGNPLGVQGILQKGISAKDVSQQLQRLTGREPMLLGSGPELVQKIAIASGGGQKEMEQAVLDGADLFVTGEVTEKNFHQAHEEGVWFVSGGHHATERFGPQALAQFLRLSGAFEQVEFLDLDNPV